MTLRSIAEAAEQIRRKKISPVELVRECLETIDRLNPTLNAFITVTADSALAEAKKAEQEIQSGNWRGPLHGIPVGLKDLIDTAGIRTTAASAVFRDRIPTEDADVVKKLKAAGAVFVGKQNLQEFAYGSSSVISHFGPVRNPVNPEFIAGGSSVGLRRRGRVRNVLRRDWHRHRRLNSRAGSTLRSSRTEAVLWISEHARNHSAFAITRSCWTNHAHRRGCGDCARRHRGNA